MGDLYKRFVPADREARVKRPAAEALQLPSAAKQTPPPVLLKTGIVAVEWAKGALGTAQKCQESSVPGQPTWSPGSTFAGGKLLVMVDCFLGDAYYLQGDSVYMTKTNLLAQEGLWGRAQEAVASAE